MSDEAALLKAICTHAEEDTPRLAYADWLDEHDRHAQAEFIRVQIRLATSTAADPDYPDLVERYAELVAQFEPRAKATLPELPTNFEFTPDFDRDEDNFHRGFPYSVRGEWRNTAPSEQELEHIRSGLAQVIATTTARQLELVEVTGDQVTSTLAAPGAEALTGLVVMHVGYTAHEGDDVLRALTRVRSLRTLQSLTIYGYSSATGFGELGAIKFERLAHLELPMLLGGRSSAMAPALESKWFRELRSVRVGSSDESHVRAVLAALARLPQLDYLDLRCDSTDALKALGAPRGFPALSRLSMSHAPSKDALTKMVDARFPRLAELSITSLPNPFAMKLLGADWFAQLRCISFVDGGVGEKFFVALSKGAVAANLRALQIGGSDPGPAGMLALANGSRFPNLTTLDFASWKSSRIDANAVADFVRTLNLPRLRHLNLSGCVLGDEGAKALAANPALANLTRLIISDCNIGAKGLTALAHSPHLHQLIELDVQRNKLTSVAALLDMDLLPRLAALRLEGTRVPPAAQRKLLAARGWVA